MHAIPQFHPTWRHATIPTYVVSYAFPLLFVVYEVYRVGDWIARNGWHFAGFKGMGYEYALMLAVFVVQICTEGLFLVLARFTRNPDFERRLTNLTLGLLGSALVLAFDFALQIAF